MGLGTVFPVRSNNRHFSESTGCFNQADNPGGTDAVIIGNENSFHKQSCLQSSSQNGQRMAGRDLYRVMLLQIPQDQFSNVRLDIPDDRAGEIKVEVSCAGGTVIAHTKGEGV